MVLFANRAVLTGAGVDTPPLTGWTWDDFRRAARQVTADTDADGRPEVYAFDFPRNLYQWVPFVWSAGGDILGRDGTVASGFLDGQPALDAYRLLTGMAEDGLTPGAQYVQQGDPAREARFASGGQAFLLSGHWTLPVFRALVEDGELDLAILPIPHHPSRTAPTTVLYASAWAVPPRGRTCGKRWRWRGSWRRRKHSACGPGPVSPSPRGPMSRPNSPRRTPPESRPRSWLW